MACGSGGGATCSQPPFRQAVQFEHALTLKVNLGAALLRLGLLSQRGVDLFVNIYITNIFPNFHCEALFCTRVISEVPSLHYDLNKPKHNYRSLNFC